MSELWRAWIPPLLLSRIERVAPYVRIFPQAPCPGRADRGVADGTAATVVSVENCDAEAHLPLLPPDNLPRIR